MKDFRLKPMNNNNAPKERKKSKLFAKSDPTWKKINLTICAVMMFIGAGIVYSRDRDVDVILVFVGFGIAFLIFGFYNKKPTTAEGEENTATQIEQTSSHHEDRH
jgi:amino acid permease